MRLFFGKYYDANPKSFLDDLSLINSNYIQINLIKTLQKTRMYTNQF